MLYLNILTIILINVQNYTSHSESLTYLSDVVREKENQEDEKGKIRGE